MIRHHFVHAEFRSKGGEAVGFADRLEILAQVRAGRMLRV